MQRDQGNKVGVAAAGVVWALLCACGPGGADDSTAEGEAAEGGEVDSSPDPFDLETEWPGVFFVEISLGGATGASAVSAMEFRADHKVVLYQLKCDGTRISENLTDWRVSEEVGVIEILGDGSGAVEVGEVFEKIFVENEVCGPHKSVRYTGLELLSVGGNYCPKDIVEDIEGFKTCDFVPCDERAIRCAAEAEAAEGD